MEDTIYDVDQVAEPNNESGKFESAFIAIEGIAMEIRFLLEFCLHIRYGHVDLLHRDLHSSIQGHQARNLSIQIDVRLQVIHIKLDAAHGQVRNVQ